MELSKTELRILEQVARGNHPISNIAMALQKSEKQIYVGIKRLVDKGIITLHRGMVKGIHDLHVTLLLQLLSDTPYVVDMLADSGTLILQLLETSHTAGQIIQKTGYRKSIVYRKLKKGISHNMIIERERTYQWNPKMWPLLKSFLHEINKREQTIDSRIPPSSVIYYKDKDEIVFSTKEELDAPLTAFSVYKNFGITIYNITYFYYFPKKKLSVEEVFRHSLYITEKTGEIRHIIFVALFYLKHRKKLSKIQHPILEKLKRTFYGEKFDRFPSLQEIKDRAAVYDLEVRP
jgi:predicted transcriptional regulator